MTGKFKPSKIIIVLLLSTAFCLFSCVTDNEPAYTSFGIYLVEDGSLVLSDADIGAYIKAEHTLELNQQGIIKWNSHIQYDSNQTPPTPGLNGSLFQKEFTVKLDNDIIYGGKFWSMVSSLSCSSIVILDAIVACDSAHKSITIENGYASHLPVDVRENSRIFDFFNSKGKLQ
jgi:hypothetical protein